MEDTLFDRFFQGKARDFLLRAIDGALEEDGLDVTSAAVFTETDILEARITAKETTLVVGLPLIRLTLDRRPPHGPRCAVTLDVGEASLVGPGTVVATLRGQAALILSVERVILNFICHLSGVANLTSRYVAALAGTRTRLLDTRKTLPGLRYPEKYAVLQGGGLNHRKDLREMCMLKDNHIDRAGGIAPAVAALRAAFPLEGDPALPPIEIECRDLDEVRSAAACEVSRIMLDNMEPEMISLALSLIPDHIETEVSGGVSLENIAALGRLGPDFISAGRLTHSAPAADFSMRIEKKRTTMTRMAEASQRIEDIRAAMGEDLLIMGHHYQGGLVIEHTDFRGDSLELSRRAPNATARTIVFCGVYFMAESAALLVKPGQSVYTPAMDAKCVMSEAAPAELVEAVLGRLRVSGRKITPLAYVNSSAAVKALCGRFGGSVCTSANASTMLRWAMEQGDGVLFLPDKNLALNTADRLGIESRHVLDIRGAGERLDPDAARTAELLIWPGCCPVHHLFSLEQIRLAREAHPGARILVHPECRPEVVKAADGAGSTSYLIRSAAETPPGEVLYIGTEINLVQRLAKDYAGQKRILPLAHSACRNMAKTTKRKLLTLLAALHAGDPPAAVTVPEAMAVHARIALERMLAACA